MPKYSVEISDTAQPDINEIIAYTNRELKNHQSAKRLAANFRNNILSLEEMPKRYNLVNDEMLSRNGIRKLIIENYLVFYIVDELKGKVSIVRVLQSRRDWDKLI